MSKQQLYAVMVQPNELPKIIPVDDSETEIGMLWRDAKKAVRAWYLDQAAALRQVSEKNYFNA